MSDFPEKDINSAQETEETEKFSSIFSDPAAHKEVKIKKKKNWTKVLASVLALCILAGATVAVIKLIPVLEEDDEISSPVEEISVKDLQSDDISKMTVTNTVGTTEFYSETTKEDDTETTSWYLKSVDKSLTDSSSIASVVSAMCSISSTRKITEKTTEECGFASSKLKAVVEPKQGDKYTVILGSKSPDNSGYYLKLDSSEDIYLVSDEVYNALQFELLDFADTTAMPGITNDDGELDDYFANDQLARFDRLTLKGDKHPKGVEIVYNDDDRISQYLGYMVNYPEKRVADNTAPLVTLYQGGVSVIGAYSYAAGAASIKKFGLDNPDLETKIYVGKKTLTYKFSLQEDGNYAAVYDDSKLIHKVAPSTLEGIIELETADYYSDWIFYQIIDDVKTFTIKTNEETYEFGIKKNEVDEDAEEEQENYTITCNGKKLVAQNFQNLYAYLVSLNCDDFTVDNVSNKPDVTLDIKLNDGSKQVIEFTKFSATKYQCSVDGKVVGKVTASSVSKMIKYTQKVANGETVGTIN